MQIKKTFRAILISMLLLALLSPYPLMYMRYQIKTRIYHCNSLILLSCPRKTY